MGWPQKGRIFLRGMRLLPPRAGMMAMAMVFLYEKPIKPYRQDCNLFEVENGQLRWFCWHGMIETIDGKRDNQKSWRGKQ